MPPAWLTPAEPAALAVLRLHQPPPLDRLPPALGRVAFARLLRRDGGVIDEVVVLGGDGWWEVCCHGGAGVRAAVAAELAPLPAPADATDAWSTLASAAHPAAVAWLLAHGDAPPPFLRGFLTRAPVVLIAGAANAGKSTLLNAWCGCRRAVVDAAPGTTRDLVTAEVLVHGWRLRLCDSAGERATDDPLERAGQELARAARTRADLVLWLDLPGGPPAPAEALVVAAQADVHDPLGRGRPWSARTDDAPRLLAGLGLAVLERLGLPLLDQSAPNT